MRYLVSTVPVLAMILGLWACKQRTDSVLKDVSVSASMNGAYAVTYYYSLSRNKTYIRQGLCSENKEVSYANCEGDTAPKIRYTDFKRELQNVVKERNADHSRQRTILNKAVVYAREQVLQAGLRQREASSDEEKQRIQKSIDALEKEAQRAEAKLEALTAIAEVYEKEAASYQSVLKALEDRQQTPFVTNSGDANIRPYVAAFIEVFARLATSFRGPNGLTWATFGMGAFDDAAAICTEKLGPGARLPTDAEVTDAMKSGLRRSRLAKGLLPDTRQGWSGGERELRVFYTSDMPEHHHRNISFMGRLDLDHSMSPTAQLRRFYANVRSPMTEHAGSLVLRAIPSRNGPVFDRNHESFRDLLVAANIVCVVKK